MSPPAVSTRRGEVIALPDNAAARRERQLRAKWDEEDRVTARLRALRAEIAPLQRDVSKDRGYLFTVSREALQRPAKAKRP